MFTGHLIDDLMQTVERTERQTQVQLLMSWAEPEPMPYPALTAGVLQWRGTERVSVGVA